MSAPLPDLLCGPIVRHVSQNDVMIWLVLSKPCDITLSLYPQDDQPEASQRFVFDARHEGSLVLGEHAYLHLLHVKPESPLAEGSVVGYDLSWDDQHLSKLHPELCYKGSRTPQFKYAKRLSNLLHGSCRKIHFGQSGEPNDALVSADRYVETQCAEHSTRAKALPDALIMSGDQVYVDDIAGPTLKAIQDLIAALGLFQNECFSEACVANAQELLSHSGNFYGRRTLLPNTRENASLQARFFGGVEKPIFTTVTADNHLVSLSEVVALYLLTWSAQCWPLVNMQEPPSGLSAANQKHYQRDLPIVAQFAEGLPAVSRLFANVPCYMLFDDHDVTDDWNLTRGWEESAYGHPFSRQIIGNALMAYWAFQAWGNKPEQFDEDFLRTVKNGFAAFENNTPDRQKTHRALTDQLLSFDRWHFQLGTEPSLVFLDTRTHRWRSERNPNRPSGLMDWEALSELQQQLLDKDAVILVSPAPVFGVKLIEVVQRIFTWFGHALTVDAENWMAHPGSANVVLNIFLHKRTPKRFTILSGDVHYSFAYDVDIRRGDNNPHIWQITASGFSNAFPEMLLRCFDRLNRVLFSVHSPLNWLTRRRAFSVRQRQPDPKQSFNRLINGPSVGLLKLDEHGEPSEIGLIMPDGDYLSFIDKGEAERVN